MTEGEARVEYVVATDHVVCADLDDEAVLLDVTSGQYYGLDEIGRQVWVLLESGRDLEAIVATLAAEYEAEPVALRTDVIAFLESLVARGLLRPATAPVAAR